MRKRQVNKGKRENNRWREGENRREFWSKKWGTKIEKKCEKRKKQTWRKERENMKKRKHKKDKKGENGEKKTKEKGKNSCPICNSMCGEVTLFKYCQKERGWTKKLD